MKQENYSNSFVFFELKINYFKYPEKDEYYLIKPYGEKTAKIMTKSDLDITCLEINHQNVCTSYRLIVLEADFFYR